jgi:predicted nucleic acid-binding protein
LAATVLLHGKLIVDKLFCFVEEGGIYFIWSGKKWYTPLIEDVHERAITEFLECIESLFVDGFVSSTVGVPDQGLSILRRPELLISALFLRSRRQLVEWRNQTDLVINPIIYAEASVRFEVAEDFEQMIVDAGFRREGLPWTAAFAAGKAHREYRSRGGSRSGTLPDFFIGAHAAARGYALLTRDPRRYRIYFPAVELIAPDSHP